MSPEHSPDHSISLREAQKETIERYIDQLFEMYPYDTEAHPEVKRYIAARLDKLVAQVIASYGSLENVKGKRILDIGCGSRHSLWPPDADSPKTLAELSTTPVFEPWLCRFLILAGADPVGIDMNDNSTEAFTSFKVDIAVPGALNFLPDESFDGVLDHSLFGSPEFMQMHPVRAERLAIVEEIKKQEGRLLKKDGALITTSTYGIIF